MTVQCQVFAKGRPGSRANSAGRRAITCPWDGDPPLLKATLCRQRPYEINSGRNTHQIASPTARAGDRAAACGLVPRVMEPEGRDPFQLFLSKYEWQLCGTK